MQKVRAQLEVQAIAGKPAEPDTILTVESDTDHPHLALLRWPGAPPIAVFWPDLEQAINRIKKEVV